MEVGSNTLDDVYNKHLEFESKMEGDMKRKMALSVGQEEKIAALPMEDTIWLIKEMDQETRQDGAVHRYLSIVERSGKGVGVTNVDISKFSLTEHAYNLICYCALFPLVRQPRRPRLCTFMNKALARIHSIDLSKLRITFICPAMLKMSKPDGDVPWMRVCSLCRLRGTPDLFKTCSSCQAVIYCSKECQKKAWSKKGEQKSHSHKSWCQKMKQFMSKTEELAVFPFTFARETTSIEFNMLRCQQFLEDRGLYNQGLWCRESAMWTLDGKFVEFGDLVHGDNPIVLPAESSILSSPPDNKAPDIMSPLMDWGSYYQWRGFRIDSPIAVLMNFPLTLYYVLTTCLPRDYPTMKMSQGKKYVVDILGAEKEVELFSVFKELSVLMPDIELTLNLIGDEMATSVDGKLEQDGKLTFRIHRKFYHNYIGERSHIAIGFNSGLAAYQDWMQTVKKLKVNNIPTYMTDYCEHSCECAKLSVEGADVGTCTDVEVNPFRSPLRKVCEENNTPWYSNAFIYRLVFKNPSFS